MEVVKEDEIDLFDLVKVVYRWKFLVLGIIITGLMIISLIFYQTPLSYTTIVTIKIGKIAGTPIERFEDLKLHLLSLKKDDNYKTAEITIDKKMSSADLDIVVLSLSSTDPNFDETIKIIDQTAKLIIDRHEKIYSDSLKKIKNIDLGNCLYAVPNYYLIVS